jgi:uncharacterized protein (TIGR02466 family)
VADPIQNCVDTSAADEDGQLLLLWPTALYVSRHDVRTSPWHGDLHQEIMRRANAGRAFRGDWASADLFSWNAPCIEPFGRFLIQQVSRRLRYDLGLAAGQQLRCRREAWVNVRSGGEWHQPHVHDKSTLSFVYYIKVPDGRDQIDIRPHKGMVKGGIIQFQDPRGSAPYMGSEIASVFSAAVRFVPEPGMLLIFPSFVSHLVAPIISDEPRISVGGNFGGLQVVK